MGIIPRKISEDKVIGYVVFSIGALPCENSNDKIKLKAYAQQYLDAMDRGAIIEPLNSFPVVDGSATKIDRNVLNILMNHAAKNVDSLPPKLHSICKVFLEKSRKNIIFIPKKIIDELI